VSDIGGSEMRKCGDTFAVPMTSLVLSIMCLQVSFVGKVWQWAWQAHYFEPRWSRSDSKSAAVKCALHRYRLCPDLLGRSARLIWFIQTTRSLLSFGRWCSVMPWWMEHPSAKHTGIVFE